MAIKIGFATDQGKRVANEDFCCALQGFVLGQPVVLLGVSDGMGGSTNGARAAQEIISTLGLFMGFLRARPGANQAGQFNDLTREIVTQAIETWNKSAKDHLELIARTEQLSGLSTTLVACFAWGNKLAVWWMGDSRLYRYRKGKLERLTLDHSTVEETLHLTEEMALEHHARNELTRFYRPGINYQLPIEFFDWQEGDLILAVTDGVSGCFRSWELEAFLTYWLASEIDPTDLCQQILKYIQPNISDNATIVIATNGAVKPFAREVATAELATFAYYGLKPELVQSLTNYPSTTQQWQAREVPPWRQVVNGERFNNVPPRAVTSVENLAPYSPETGVNVCLDCGLILTLGENCPKHAITRLWNGLYFEIISPKGEIKRIPVEGGCKDLLIGRDSWPTTDIQLTGDEFVSPGHLLIKLDAEEAIRLEDRNSDNGVWLQVRNIRLNKKSWLEDGVNMRIGKHQLHLRTPASQVKGSLREQQIENFFSPENVTLKLENEPRQGF